jgi:hypothetical protein
MGKGFWLFIILLILGLLALVSYMRRQFQKSREIEKQIDYSKIRKWKDDD